MTKSENVAPVPSGTADTIAADLTSWSTHLSDQTILIIAAVIFGCLLLGVFAYLVFSPDKHPHSDQTDFDQEEDLLNADQLNALLPKNKDIGSTAANSDKTQATPVLNTQNTKRSVSNDSLKTQIPAQSPNALKTQIPSQPHQHSSSSQDLSGSQTTSSLSTQAGETNSSDPKEHAHLIQSADALLKYSIQHNDELVVNQAMSIYRQALSSLNPNQFPLDWANTQLKLGDALRFQAHQQQNPPEILQQAIQAYQKSLKIYTKDQSPLYWAKAHMNMGKSLLSLWENNQDVEILKAAQTSLNNAKNVMRYQKQSQHSTLSKASA